MSKPATLASQTDAPIKTRRIGVFLGAEVTGVDLSKPLEEAVVRAIGEAHANYEVLVFPRQKISAQDLMRFGRYFGELSVHPFSTNAAGGLPSLLS